MSLKTVVKYILITYFIVCYYFQLTLAGSVQVEFLRWISALRASMYPSCVYRSLF